MSPKILASDSKLHIRVKPGRQPFRGLMGVVVQCDDLEKFKTQYDKILGAFFKRNLFGRQKRVYKATEIASLNPGPPWRFRGILRAFAREFFQVPGIDISVLFCTLNLRSLRERKIKSLPEDHKEHELRKMIEDPSSAEVIQIYGEPGSEPVEYVSVTKFFEIVRQYFPIVCLGSVCETAHLSGCEIIMDGCSGPRFGYWDLLVQSDNKFTIAPHGDSCNCLISTADILVRWIDEELRQARLPLNMSVMIRLLREWVGVTAEIDTSHIHIGHLSNKDLGKIKPLSKTQIQTFDPIYLRHPIHFIVLEEQTKVERSRFENSPIMYKIHDKLSESDGSYVFWNSLRHPRVIRKGDVMVIYGENGQKEVDKLIRLEYSVDIWDLRK